MDIAELQKAVGAEADGVWGANSRKALIDAFRIVDDEDLVGRYRRQMSALLLS